MWKIYYGNGETYTGSVENAPARNVQTIAQSDPDHGFQVVSGGDYYVWIDGRWDRKDRFGLYDYLIEPGWKKVLFGRTLTADEYNGVWHRMMNDPELPSRTGGPSWEWRP